MTIVDHKARTPMLDWLLVQQMDECHRIAASATRVHDTLAAELGYRRVPVNQVTDTDTLVVGGVHHKVVAVQHYTDEIASWYRVTFCCDTTGTWHTEAYDDGELVSVAIPPIDEPF